MRLLKLTGILPLVAALIVPVGPACSLSCETGPYFIFFGADNAFVIGEPMQILENAMAAVGNCGAAHVYIAGHTDVGEEPSLAVVRANTVAAYFTARGVPATEVSVIAFGATVPRRTNSGTEAEPENRRVEITFGPPQTEPVN